MVALVRTFACFTLVVAAALLWPSTVTSSDLGLVAYYVDVQSPQPVEIRIAADSVESHRRTERNTCKASPEFYCMRTPSLRFAAPKNFTGQKEWTVASTRYRVIVERELFLSDSLQRTLLIREETNDSAGGFLFLFSPERGLVGLWHSKPANPSFFLLQGRCGYAAPSTCSPSVTR
jgi:hypothetical protein